MTSTLVSKVVVAAAVGVAALSSCANTERTPGQASAGSSLATAGRVGSNAGSESGGSAPSNAGSKSSGGTSADTAGSGGTSADTAGSGGGLVTAGAAGDSSGGISGNGSGGISGGGSGPIVDVREVWPSNGCGKAYNGPTAPDKGTLATMGAKDPNCNDKLANGTPRCGLWGQIGSAWLSEPLVRDYYVFLPAGYDSTKVYPLVFQGPGCGGNGTQIYPLNDGTGPNVGNSVIRIGLTPASTDVIGHGCCPFGCFDDKEGDDSVDFVFYENLYDKLSTELCFDRNRVFTAGNSSGAWLANELACKYAGDAKRPVRAPLVNSGGLPIAAAEVPTCTNAPMAGMWVQETNDPDGPINYNWVAVNRAMAHNDCLATSYQGAEKANFPIGGGVADDVCKVITNCNPMYPLVVCELPGNAHGSHDSTVNPGFSTFVKMLSLAPFIVP